MIWRDKTGAPSKWSGTIPPGPWVVKEDRTACKTKDDEGRTRRLSEDEPKPCHLKAVR